MVIKVVLTCMKGAPAPQIGVTPHIQNLSLRIASQQRECVLSRFRQSGFGGWYKKGGWQEAWVYVGRGEPLPKSHLGPISSTQGGGHCMGSSGRHTCEKTHLHFHTNVLHADHHPASSYMVPATSNSIPSFYATLAWHELRHSRPSTSNLIWYQ